MLVETKCEDLWFEGINLKTAEEGCFPGQYVTEYTGDSETPFGENYEKSYSTQCTALPVSVQHATAHATVVCDA